VDVYERLDEPEVFDVWRLGTYFRSLGPRGRKVLAKACGMSETAIDDAVVLVTEELLRAGLVGKDGSGFSVLND
jgi:hypothetical protein